MESRDHFGIQFVLFSLPLHSEHNVYWDLGPCLYMCPVIISLEILPSLEDIDIVYTDGWTFWILYFIH